MAVISVVQELFMKRFFAGFGAFRICRDFSGWLRWRQRVDQLLHQSAQVERFTLQEKMLHFLQS